MDPRSYSSRTRRRTDRQGFTLIELLVVIAVIAILLALLYPLTVKGLNMAKDTKCRGNMKSIGNAFLALAYDHEGILPGNVSGQPPNAQPWQKAWLGDEVLKPGDVFPSHWIPGVVQQAPGSPLHLKGTIYEYVKVNFESAQNIYRCPQVKEGVYGQYQTGGNGRFDYSALHVFSGAFIDLVPNSCEAMTTPFGSTLLRTMSTPILIEEDAHWWLNKGPNIEPGAGNQDHMALNHEGRSNFFGADGAVHSHAWNFVRDGRKVGPNMNYFRGKTPNGNWSWYQGSHYGGWNNR